MKFILFFVAVCLVAALCFDVSDAQVIAATPHAHYYGYPHGYYGAYDPYGYGYAAAGYPYGTYAFLKK